MRLHVVIASIALVVGACSSSSSSTFGQLEIQTISADGSQTPLQGVRIQVNDSAWTPTDASGKATFTNVHRPYTVRTDFTVRDSPPILNLQEIQSLDVNPLVLNIDALLYLQSHSAHVTGSVANASGASGSKVNVLAVSTPSTSPETQHTNADGTFDINTLWSGAATQTIQLRAFESDSANPPTHYTGYASQGVLASDPNYADPAVSGISLQLAPVNETRISGNVSLDSALGSAKLDPVLNLVFPDSSWILLASGGSAASGAFDFAQPQIGASAAVLNFHLSGQSEGQAQSSDKQRLQLQSGASLTGLSFNLPAPVSLTTPADGASIASGTTFHWAAGPAGGHYEAQIECHLVGSGGSYSKSLGWNIATTDTQATLFTTPVSNVSSGMSCTWAVYWDSRDISALGAGPLDWTQSLKSSTTASRSAVVP